MTFKIIKKAAAKAAQAVSQQRPSRPTIKTTRKPEPMLWGVVGHKHHRDGSVQRIYSSVPRSEASPWLKQQQR